MINALVKTIEKRHMQFLTSAPNFRGGGSAGPPDPTYPSPCLHIRHGYVHACIVVSRFAASVVNCNVLIINTGVRRLAATVLGTSPATTHLIEVCLAVLVRTSHVGLCSKKPERTKNLSSMSFCCRYMRYFSACDLRPLFPLIVW